MKKLPKRTVFLKTLSDVKRLEAQRDILMKKLADSDSDILRLRSELLQKSNDLEQVLDQVPKNSFFFVTSESKFTETPLVAVWLYQL